MKNFKGKAIYNPSGKAGEYSFWACNFYVGCSNGCTYCYCKKGILAGVMGQDKPQLKKCFKDEADAFTIFRKELSKNKVELRKHGLFFSFTTDPLLPETKELTFEAIEMCLLNWIPVKILTKCTEWINSFEFERFEGIENEVAFGFTLTGHDNLEPGASTNLQRIVAMEKLHRLGFKTFASIEPIIDFNRAKEMIVMSMGDCDLYKIGLMSGKNYDQHKAQLFVEWLSDLRWEPKIYLKESIQKLTRYTTEELGDNFVDRDYNMFNPNNEAK